jgi:hypothetical protein
VKSPRQKINERGEKPGAGIILSKRKGGINNITTTTTAASTAPHIKQISLIYHCYQCFSTATQLPLLYIQVHSIVFLPIAVFIEGILSLHRFPTIEAALSHAKSF